MSEDMVICGAHGETPVTFVCQHIAAGVACGFHADRATAKNRFPDAWCDLCEDVLAKAGRWTSRATKTADIKCLCTHCYTAARDRNRKVPKPARGKATRLSRDESAAFIDRAVHAAKAMQAKSLAKHGFEALDWHYDGATNQLSFGENNRTVAIADARLVGSFSMNTSTFQWSWATLPDDHPDMRELARLQKFGVVRGIRRLSTANFKATEYDGWEMSAVAAYLLGADAIFRAPMDHLYWFMLLTNVRKVTGTKTSGGRSRSSARASRRR